MNCLPGAYLADKGLLASVDPPVLLHAVLLPEGLLAELADEGLHTGVGLEVLLKVGPRAVDEDAADRAALVLAPVVVHVLVEVLQAVEGQVALVAVHRPVVVRHLVLLVIDQVIVHL